MSARREKRLRKLEARVAALESIESERADRMARIQKANEDYWRERSKVLDMVITNDPPRRSLWRRLLDAFRGRDGA